MGTSHSIQKFALVFPGQGSQSMGMLDVWGEHPVVRETLSEASEVLGEDVGALIHAGPKERLDLTTNTQPVMLTVGIACYRVWLAETGLLPAVAAGHSLGEYTALVAAEVLELSDALALVRFRAQAMQEAVPVGVGAMAAILGLDGGLIHECCVEIAATTGETIEAVNFNDPKQTVIAGTTSGVDQACSALKAMGAKRVLLLPVSAPFHSSLMKPAAERLKSRLAMMSFAVPKFPVINNVDVKAQTSPSDVLDALCRQAYSPVRWVEVVLALRAHGVSHVFEFGPGKVLAGMIQRIDAELVSAPVFDMATLAEAKGLLA